MKLVNLKKTVEEHHGEFLCEQIHDPESKKIIRFKHTIGLMTKSVNIPNIGKLPEFYDTFGSIIFYHDEISGDAARRIAAPSEWDDLNSDFSEWLMDLNDEEYSEIVPDWINFRLVIGETPATGNYILMIKEGTFAGQIFEFDHDGFEFFYRANNIVDYVYDLINVDADKLADFASSMRFINDVNPMIQWYIKQLKDNKGVVLSF